MRALEIAILALIALILAALLVPPMLTPPDPEDDGLLEFDLESVGLDDPPPSPK